jgi:hypothetical protein
MSAAPTVSSWLNLPQRLRQPEFSFLELLFQFSRDLRVAVPGIVQSFNATAQTVTVQIAIREMINVITADGQGGAAPVPTPTQIQILSDVPICTYGGGGFEVTLPIAIGDECLVVFGDSCMSAWWANGGVQNPEVSRRHNLSDGFAIIGPRSQPRKLANYSTDSLQIRSDDGNTVIDVQSGQIETTVDGGTTTTKSTPGSIVWSPDGGTTQISITPGVINLTAATVNVNGDEVVSGGIDVADTIVGHDDAVISGIAYVAHEHSGVTTGSGTSGPPV